MYLRLSLPQLPISGSDTVEYLSPAVRMVFTGYYIPTYRDFLYPCFLTAVLMTTQSLYAIALIQHLSGVAAAALVVTTIFRLRVFLPANTAFDWGTRAVALLAACELLFSQFTILMEHSIRPEGLFPVACAVTILAGVELSRRVLVKKYDGVAMLWSIILAFFSVGNLYLKPAWGFAAGTSLVPLILMWLLIPGRWLWKCGTSFMGVVFTFGVVIFRGQLWEKQYGPNYFLPGTLLSTHAEILYDIFQKDALHLPVKSKTRSYILEFMRDVQSAKQSPTVCRYGFQINPDDILYSGPVEKLKSQFLNTRDFSKAILSEIISEHNGF